MLKHIATLVLLLTITSTSKGESEFVPPPNKTLVFVAGGPNNEDYQGFEKVTGKKPSGQDLWLYRTIPAAISELGEPENTSLFIHLTMKKSDDFEYDGNYESIRQNIRRIGQRLKALDRPVFLAIGGEVEFFYPLSAFKDAFRRIHDEFESMGVTNVSYVFHMACHQNASIEEIDYYYPGDQYVDVLACSFYGPGNVPGARRLANYAKRHGKAFGIAECGNFVIKDAHEKWNQYWKHVFDFVKTTDARFMVFLNCGNSLGTFPTMSPSVKAKWREEMHKPRYILSDEKFYKKIGYQP